MATRSMELVRLAIAALATIVAVVIGVSVTGAFDATPDANGIPAGSNMFALILALSLLIGVVAWAIVERLQTGRIASIARQFGTRTIVLMVVAVALNITLGQTVGTALKLPLYLDSIGTILVGVLCGPVAGAATGILSNFVWSFALAATPLAGPYAWPFAIVAGVIGLLAGLFGYAGVFRRRLDTPPPQLILGVAAAAAAIGALLWWGVIPYYRDLCPEGTAAGSFCFQLLVQGPIEPIWLVLGFVVLGLIVAALVLLLIRLVIARDLGAVIVIVAGTGTGIITALVAAPIVVLLGGVTGGGTDLLVAAFQQAGSDLQQAVVQQSLLVDPVDKAIEFSIAYMLLGSMSKRVAARFPQGERSLAADEA